MTASQVKWAAQHDWYSGKRRNGVFWIVEVMEQQADGNDQLKLFSNFQDLQEWAGY